ncbi:glycosyltransferase [Halorubrum sp. AS12]|uniref:glycosyltransferase n=1 Tax=Halorubrum sp. AS12 TaxID=3409687 RepID=UPI003DA72925
MDVCHFINTLAHAGAERIVYDIINKTNNDNIKYDVCYFGVDHDRREDLEELGIEVTSFDANSLLDVRVIPRVISHFNQNEYDLIHLHLPHARSIGRIAGTISNSRIISTYHNIPSQFHPVIRAADKATVFADNRTVSVSRGVKNEMVDSHVYSMKKIKTINNGIDIEELNKLIKSSSMKKVKEKLDFEDKFVFLNIGRYVKQKSQIDIIKAMETVVKSEPKAHLILVGGGPLENKLRSCVKECNLSSNVSILGFVESINPYLRLADTYVSYSRNEGLPISLLEAMSGGLPIIASDVPGNNDVVKDGKTGYLIPRTNVSILSERMIDIIQSDEAYTMGQRGLEMAKKRFNAERMVSEYVSEYKMLVGDE